MLPAGTFAAHKVAWRLYRAADGAVVARIYWLFCNWPAAGYMCLPGDVFILPARPPRRACAWRGRARTYPENPRPTLDISRVSAPDHACAQGMEEAARQIFCCRRTGYRYLLRITAFLAKLRGSGLPCLTLPETLPGDISRRQRILRAGRSASTRWVDVVRAMDPKISLTNLPLARAIGLRLVLGYLCSRAGRDWRALRRCCGKYGRASAPTPLDVGGITREKTSLYRMCCSKAGPVRCGGAARPAFRRHARVRRGICSASAIASNDIMQGACSRSPYAGVLGRYRRAASHSPLFSFTLGCLFNR